jgi:putative oxidoreductase
MSLLQRLLSTSNDPALTILRVTAGVVVSAHGAQKLLGWFGGHGPGATMASFQEWFGLPPFVTALVILSDSVGALALVVGAFTRLAAAGVTLVMIGAIVLVHGRWGFFMNWYSQPRGEGFEYHLLVIAIALVLVMRGGGAASLDRTWSGSRGEARSA